MVSEAFVKSELKRIGFKQHGWGKAEVNELPHLLIEGEEIFECVNGMYEGGFALLVASDIRLLLIDKKPFNYLSVEDLRFDNINEIDYSHRALGASITVSTGSKTLKFRSYNQPRLKKLIGHVQHCMAESKKKQTDHQQDQNQHLEQMNQLLQAYLKAQYQQQEQLQQQLIASPGSPQQAVPAPLADPVQVPKELSDYLFAQSLLAQHQAQTGQPLPATVPQVGLVHLQAARQAIGLPASIQASDLQAEGMQEVYGKRKRRLVAGAVAAIRPVAQQTTVDSRV